MWVRAFEVTGSLYSVGDLANQAADILQGIEDAGIPVSSGRLERPPEVCLDPWKAESDAVETAVPRKRHVEPPITRTMCGAPLTGIIWDQARQLSMVESTPEQEQAATLQAYQARQLWMKEMLGRGVSPSELASTRAAELLARRTQPEPAGRHAT